MPNKKGIRYSDVFFFNQMGLKTECSDHAVSGVTSLTTNHFQIAIKSNDL